MRRRLGLIPALLVAPLLGGCAIGHLAAAMGQNFEYQKQIEVLPKYEGLEGKRVAVVVDAEMSTLYEHPDLVGKITSGVTARIGRDVPDTQVMRPADVIAWQWRTPQWNAMSRAEMAEDLGVDRVVLIEIYEYRLNPPGNRWLWEGVCAANVSVIEADGFDPDTFADTFTVTGEFPTISGVDRTQATAATIETGVLAEFIKRTAWLFHTHLEPKYPDKYQPPPEAGK